MSFWLLIKQELKSIFADKAILMTVIGGVVFYAILYPLPYAYQVPTEQLVVVVDNDNSSLSRAVIRHADASPKIKIIAKVNSIEEAKRWINERKAYGLLVIPRDFRRDIIIGKGATLSYGGDASYFLIYSAIAQGLIEVGLNAGKSLQRFALLAKGKNNKSVKKALNSIKLNSLPAFNSSLGYTPYIVPGLFLLILHQTLLIGTGILGASQWGKKGEWLQHNASTLILARACAFVSLYTPLSSFYIGYCYYFYQVNLLASLSEVLLLMLPFLLATTFAGITLSALFSQRDLPTQVFLLSSMPILFVCGFVWPVALIPAPIVWLSQLVPAVPAIKAMLSLNQMGAPWDTIITQWLHLWGLFCLFFTTALFAINKRKKIFLAKQGE